MSAGRLAPQAASGRWNAVLWALLPLAAWAAASLAATGGAQGRFQAALAALVGAVLAGAFGTAIERPAAGALTLVAGPLAVGVAVALAGPADGASATAWLLLAGGVAAAGTAAVGRLAGAPAVPAGAVATALLSLAATGVFWADAVAEALPRARRRPFVQAVLHLDPALALALDGAGHDLLRHPEVYGRVALASSLYRRPQAASTGLAWLALGLAQVAVAALAGRAARRVSGGPGAAGG